MKRFLFPLIFLIVLITGVSFGYVWWNNNTKAVSASSEKVRFVIPKGYSASQIANKLYDVKLIRSPLAFKFYVQMKGETRQLKPGEFNLSKNMSLTEIVEKLLKGPDEIWVTIPEGLRREEVVIKIIKQLEVVNSANSFYSEFMQATKAKEGYLFPDTYLFPKDVSAQRVVDVMEATFDTKYKALIEEDNDSGFTRTKDEIVKMASIIEREAITNEERPIIAGILWKRLDTSGWLIQADATIQYAIADEQCENGNMNCDWWPILTKEDLENESLYNSYKYKNLPPTPISNPGESSLRAAMYPAESNWWFYIHDPGGIIHYGETIEEHNINIRKYLGK